MNEYVFFWGGPFSQWYTSPFTDLDGIKYTHAEQYMMYQKAKLFGDDEIAKKIMNTSVPKIQKSLGRQVKGFDPAVWAINDMRIVQNGNYFKFTQNQKLRGTLLATENKIIVEASPYDRIWGIGFDEGHALANKDMWGENKLGCCIMKVRDRIKKEI